MRTAYEFSHVKSVTAICLLKGGEPVGSIVANWSDNPAGTVCTATIKIDSNVTGENLQGRYLYGTGKAGGYGYDKLSSAIYQALKNTYYVEMDEVSRLVNIPHPIHTKIDVSPASGNQRQAFESLGVQYIEVC